MSVRAGAIPSATEIDVEAWPATNASCTLSVRLREAGDTAELPQRRKRFAPPGQELVHIALVSDVEYEPVALGIVDTVDCDRKLHRAEV